MVFALAYLGNAAANFLFGLALSAALGPAEFGLYATVAMASSVVAILVFDWLRASTLRFSLKHAEGGRAAATLEFGFLAASGLCVALGGLAALVGGSFGLGGALGPLVFGLAIANARFDFRAARLRVHDATGAFVRLSVARQLLLFTAVLAVAWVARSATATVAALVAAQILASFAGAPPRARLDQARASDMKSYIGYSAPMVAATALFVAIGFVNREIALIHFGAAATGKLSLATDLGSRLFGAFNFIPEAVLFPIAMRREARESVAAAHQQIGLNQTLSLAVIAPLAAGYWAMAPTFEALIVPYAYRGAFASLSRDLTPGLFALCAVAALCNPVFQLLHRTWPAAIAALAGFALDVTLVAVTPLGDDIGGLAIAHSASLVFAFAAAATLALSAPEAAPRWRDFLAVAFAAVAMGAAIEPLNSLRPAPLAAALALIGGGALYAALILAFDVGGLRGLAMARWRAATGRSPAL